MLPNAWRSQITLLRNSHSGPLAEIVNVAGGADSNNPPATLIVIPSTPDLNQHNVSYFGRMNGGRLVGRQLGNSQSDIEPLLKQAELILLAKGDQGSVKTTASALDKAVRSSGIFTQVQVFQRQPEGNYSLWQRKSQAAPRIDFADLFPDLAVSLSEGPTGLTAVFDSVAVQHMLDGHFNYRKKVRNSALEILKSNPSDINSHWSMALLAVLANRPNEAAIHFAVLENLLPENPWPSAYRSVVTLAGWNPWKAASIAKRAQIKHENNAVLTGLADLSDVLGGSLWRVPAASQSIPKAVSQIESSGSKASNKKEAQAQDSN